MQYQEVYRMKKVFLTLMMLIFVFSNTVFVNAEEVNFESIGSGNLGYKDGDFSVAEFRFPYGIIKNKDGEIFVADSYNHVIRKISGGKVSTIGAYSKYVDHYGFPTGAYVDGGIAEARFNEPRDIAIDSKGNIFVVDTGNHVIRVIKDNKVYTFAGAGEAGFADKKGTEAKFNQPSGIAIDKDDNLYIADTLNHVIRKITPAGEISTYAGKRSDDGDYQDGSLEEARFNEPTGLAIDGQGTLYVADSGNQRIRIIKDNKVITIAGSGTEKNDAGYIIGGYKDGAASQAQFNFPKGIDVSNEGMILIGDMFNNQIRVIKDNQVYTLKTADGVLYGPVGISYSNGSLYVSDMWNNKVKKFEVNESNLIQVEETEGEDFLQITLIPGEIQVWVNGSKVEFTDVKPYKDNGKVMVPIRKLSESLGAKVTYDAAKKEITIQKDEWKKQIFINKDPVILKDGRILVHTRFLAENLGYHVEWLDEYDTVLVTLP